MAEPDFIFFPHMHRRLVDSSVPKSVFFLDPGLRQGESPGYWRPEDLPLDGRALRQFREQALAFGRNVRSPSDLAYFKVAGMDDFYSGSTSSIKSELTSMQKNQPAEAPDLRRAAQISLAMAYYLEEDLLHLQETDKRINAQWNSLETVLGLDGDDDPLVRRPDLAVSRTEAFPWKPLLPAFVRMVSEHMVLFCLDSEVVDWVRENAVSLEQVAGAGMTCNDPDQKGNTFFRAVVPADILSQGQSPAGERKNILFCYPAS